ncbi:MAG: EamA family transporter [Acidobacteria bacterium]|nr:EamA family transporter [Acidobacteriota bacterium]MCI0719013.1 EamA family transporter [Acidobacteriota bacterium]
MDKIKNQYFPRWLSYAVLCILSWGVWGGLSKLGADKMTPMQLQVLFTIGMIPVVLAALIQLRWKVDRDLWGVTYGILNGVFTGLGLLAYYAAMARGKASIVGPVTALFPLLTVMLALFLLKERMNKVQKAGAFVALVSIFILSR